jgi:hypothetical protein
VNVLIGEILGIIYLATRSCITSQFGIIFYSVTKYYVVYATSSAGSIISYF